MSEAAIFHFGRVRSRTSGKPYIACWSSQKAVAAAKQRIRDLTPLGRVGLPAIMVVQDVNRFLGGRAAYFRYGYSTQQLHALDRFVFGACRVSSPGNTTNADTDAGWRSCSSPAPGSGSSASPAPSATPPRMPSGERCRRAV